MLEKILDKFLTTVTDPFMLFAMAVIVGLFYLLCKRDEAVKTIYSALKEQSDRMAEGNTTIASILALVEVLVYGKGGKRI
jgi:hypothetical protein